LRSPVMTMLRYVETYKFNFNKKSEKSRSSGRRYIIMSNKFCEEALTLRKRYSGEFTLVLLEHSRIE